MEREMNIAIVGNSSFSREVQEKILTYFFDHEDLKARVVAIADPDFSGPIRHKAGEMGIYMLKNYEELYDLDFDLDLIIVLRQNEKIFQEILQNKSSKTRILSYQGFKLFWDAISFEAANLREKNQEIQAILNGIRCYILVITPERTIVEVNQFFLDRMGFSREEVIGRKCHEVFYWENKPCNNMQEIEANADCPLQEVLRTNKPSQRVFPWVNRQGKVVYVEMSIYPIREPDGSIAKFIEISRDVSNLQKMNEDVNRRLELLVEERTRELKKEQKKILHQDKMASLGKLSASVVHEINNPISGILNLTLLMQRVISEGNLQEADWSDFQRYLSMMETETRRIGRITSNLLSFSRESKIVMKSVNLNRVLDNLLLLNANYLKIHSIGLEEHLDPELPEVQGDEDQLQQVFMNLFSNAVAAMEPKGGGTLEIMTKGDQDTKVIAVLRDSGVGMAQADIPKIFDPFYSTKEKGKGVGLGLSVAYGIIRQHNGSIYVTSRKEEGTTVQVTLPRQQPLESQE